MVLPLDSSIDMVGSNVRTVSNGQLTWCYLAIEVTPPRKGQKRAKKFHASHSGAPRVNQARLTPIVIPLFVETNKAFEAAFMCRIIVFDIFVVFL